MDPKQMENTMTNAVWTDPETNEMKYDWTSIRRAAANHAIASSVLEDWVFENATEDATAEELVSAYFAWLDAEKEAVQDAIYPLQLEWAQGQSDFNEPTTDRTDEIIARYIKSINHPGPVLRDAVFAAMEEWKTEVEVSA